MRLAKSLVNLKDRTHREALKAGYSWGTIEAAVSLASDPWRKRVADEVARTMADAREARSVARVTSCMPDKALRDLAELRAALLADLLVSRVASDDAPGVLAWLNGHVQRLDARPFAFAGERSQADQLRGFLARARCPLWWRRQLRRAAVRLRESEANAAGEVCAQRRQVYITDDTLHRRRGQLARNAAMMEATELENDEGQCMTLADLSAVSVSNKAIRRGELMTRIRGCEELAEGAGHRGVFLTLTAPSRFHAVLRHGGKNPKHDGSTPRDAHEWLTATWAKARARLARIGVRFYGFRVAEPHHDGCPHWHALLWAPPGELWRLVLNVRRWWLRQEGEEQGARAHRVKAVLMASGGASGYVAKYIAKGIDDEGAIGVEGHRDDDAPGVPEVAQADLFGGTAQRVEAWAAAWSIRQFQAIGQPPVTVWRELRRVDEQARGGASSRLVQAFDSVDRQGLRRASWAAYVLAQGGLMKGREYLVRIARQVEERAGRYETVEEARPVGVFDATGPKHGDGRPVVHLSNRREWKPRGAWSELGAHRAPAVHPWTRVNNCTQEAARPTLIDGRPVDFRALMRRFAAGARDEPGEVRRGNHERETFEAVGVGAGGCRSPFRPGAGARLGAGARRSAAGAAGAD